jgi:hypothetical protein
MDRTKIINGHTLKLNQERVQRPATRIVVFVHGGCLQGILTDTTGVEVLVIDEDTQGREDERLMTDRNGARFDACVAEIVPEVDTEAVQNYYRQAKEATPCD